MGNSASPGNTNRDDPRGSRENRTSNPSQREQAGNRRPMLVAVDRQGNRRSVPMSMLRPDMLEQFVGRVEDAQLQYALELSRRDFQQEPKGPPPTDTKVLESLHEQCLDLADIEEGNEQCVICCESQNVGDLAIKLPCFHCFHKTCIFPWLQKHNTCPVCRVTVTEAALSSQNIEKKVQKRKDKILELEHKHKELELDKTEFIPEKMSVAQIKSFLDRLGLKDKSSRILDKVELVDLLKKARNCSDLDDVKIPELKQRLQSFKIPLEGLLDKESMKAALKVEVDKIFNMYN